MGGQLGAMEPECGLAFPLFCGLQSCELVGGGGGAGRNRSLESSVATLAGPHVDVLLTFQGGGTGTHFILVSLHVPDCL